MLVAYYLQIDIIGLVLIAIMMCSNHSGGSERQRRVFNLLLVGTASMLVLDAVTWMLDGVASPDAILADHVGLTLYYVLTGGSAWFWLLYADIFLERKEPGPLRLVVESGPFVLNALLALASNWTGWYFVIDPVTGVYSHGSLFMVHAVLSYGYLAYCCVAALAHARAARNQVDRRQFYFLASFPIMPFFGALVQMFFYGLSLVWICSTLSLLIIFINVQNQQIATDPLTGLNNRRQLDRYLMGKVATPRAGSSIYAVMIDLDHFKDINDKLGHVTGDEALVDTAELLVRACSTNHEFLARIGGDEFIIIGETDKPGQETADGLAERVREEVREHNETANRTYQLALSLGTCVMREECLTSVDVLVNRADHKMYEEKQSRR